MSGLPMPSATTEIDMSIATTNLKFSLFLAAIPAALVIAGLSLAYSSRSTDKIDVGSQKIAAPAASTAVAELPPTQSPVLSMAGHGGMRPAFNPSGIETAPSLMQLHKTIASNRAKQGDRDRLLGEMDSKHLAEPVDAQWSAQSESAVQSASAQPVMVQSGLKPRDVSIDCRSSTCRISASFIESDDAKSWASMLVTQMGASMSQAKVAVIPRADGSSEVRIYSSRKQSSRG
jgi:hypothetical protein